MAYYVWFTLTNFMHFCRMSQSNIVICYDSKRCIAYYKQIISNITIADYLLIIIFFI